MSFFYIALKDISILLRDRKALAILLAMPLLLTTVLGFALGPLFNVPCGEINRFNIAVVQQSETEDTDLPGFLGEAERDKMLKAAALLDIHRIFFKDFLENDEVRKVMGYERLDEATALRKLDAGEITAIFFLPAGLETDYVLGRHIELKVLTGDIDFSTRAVLSGILSSFTDTVSIPRIALTVVNEERVHEGVGLFNYNGIKHGITELVEGGINDVKFTVVVEEGRQVVSALQYYAAAMGVMFILFAAVFGTKSMVDERNQLTLHRLLVSGRRGRQILCGKFVAVLMIALIQMSTMIFFTRLFFGIRWGVDLPALLMLTLSAAIAVAGFGALLAGFLKTNQGIDVFQSGVVQIMALAGGSMMPLYIMPDPMRTVAGWTINGQALIAYLQLMEGAAFSDITGSILYLLSFGLICLAIGSAIPLKGDR
ncbi:ABC transporter permease [Desulfoscipio gibsoniae]